ncbi:MAG TPA: HNH endonuclease signature motif containing protein [Acidimicrobiales bacterium]
MFDNIGTCAKGGKAAGWDGWRRTKGVDVVAVAHRGRTIPAHLRSALELRDPTCVIPGCDLRDRLEIDHVVPFAEGGPTALDNLARLRHRHHALKTHHGWVLGGGPGAWTWEPPEEPPP